MHGHAPAPATARHMALLGAVVFGSGLAGLGYELVWTRILSAALGHEMLAVLGVVAAFFFGLAVGGFALDGALRRAARPARAYAVLELVIAAWAVASIWLLPAIGQMVPRLIGATAPGWQLWAAAFALPALLLLPATVAMGGTLVALERLLAAKLGNPRVVAGVYGANTLGAVAGVAVSMVWLVPGIGLSGSLLAFAGVNVLCAAAALTAGAWPDRAPVPTPHAAATPAPGGTRLLGTLFITGVLGVAFEILVVRVASQLLENTVYSFASLLAVYLAGTAAGGLAYQRWGRGGDAAAVLGRLLAATALCCAAAAALLPALPALVAWARGFGLLGPELALACAVFLLPTAAMGALFGHQAHQVRAGRGSIGRATGINALGAAVAPAVASLLLIPLLGAATALALLAAGYIVLLPRRAGRAAWALALPAVLAAALLTALAPAAPVNVPAGGRLLTTLEGATASASVVEDAGGTRYLEVNGHFRMGGTSSRQSDWRQAQIPLLLHPAPQRALFLGVGTGATLAGAGLAATAESPPASITGVELVPEVVRLLPWFAEGGPRHALPPIITADARRFVRVGTGQYDVIVGDLFHPALDGSGALYTLEHFQAVRVRLLPGGVFCQWLPLYQLDLPSLRTIIRTFLAVYPQARAFLAHDSVRTPMLALVGPADALAPLDLAALQTRLDHAADGVSRGTRMAQPIDLLGLYVGAAPALALFAGEGALNTDDLPVVTFDAMRNVRALSSAPAGRLLAMLQGMTPDAGDLLGAAGRTQALHARLAAYWRARDAFLTAGAALPDSLAGRALLDAAAPGLLAALRLSEDFDPAYQPLLGMAQSLLRDDKPAAHRLLAEIAAAAPDRPEARQLLAGSGGMP